MYANIPPIHHRHNLLAIGLHERTLRSAAASMVTVTHERLLQNPYPKIPRDAFHRRVESVLSRARIDFPDESREQFPAYSVDRPPWLHPPPSGTVCTWPDFDRPGQDQEASEYAHSLVPAIPGQYILAFTDGVVYDSRYIGAACDIYWPNGSTDHHEISVGVGNSTTAELLAVDLALGVIHSRAHHQDVLLFTDSRIAICR